MTLALNYSKTFLKKNIAYTVIPIIILLSINIILDTISPPSKPYLNSFLYGVLFVFTSPILLISWFLMFKKPYVRIDNEKIALNCSFSLFKQKFSFNDIKESFLVENTGMKFIIKSSYYNSPGITLHMKKGGFKYIRFICLSEQDQQKVIEVFKEKGKLKD